MTSRDAPGDAVLNAYRALFGMSDVVRRAQGRTLEAFGLGPNESLYEVVATGAFWRLREYGKPTPAQPVLIVAAPIKHAYIWDLAPSASAIHYMLRQGFHVHLLEWLPVDAADENGLAEYAASAKRTCLFALRMSANDPKRTLVGGLSRCRFVLAGMH